VTLAQNWRPDFILVCEKHRTPYVVQTYKWKLSSYPFWVPTRRAGTKMTHLRNDSQAQFWEHISGGGEPDGDFRSHYETACGATNCRNKIAADAESLGRVFWEVVVSLRICALARQRGVEPDPIVIQYAAAATLVTDKAVTVTMASLRSTLSLLNTPNRSQIEGDGS
jgi:hypothetical protein